MANAIYPKWKETISQADSNSALNSAEGVTGVYVALVDTGTYTYSTAHQFYSSLSGVIGTDQEITTKTQVDGVFDGDDVTWTGVSGASVEALVFFRKNAGADTTWPLITYIDASVTNLPVTPNGGDISSTWNASGIFAI